MKAVALALFAFVALGGEALAASGSLDVTIQIDPALSVTASAPATLVCDAAAGTVVSHITTAGSGAGSATLGLTGDTTDFALSATTAPADLVVAAGGITSNGLSCATIPAGGGTASVTITATTP